MIYDTYSYVTTFSNCKLRSHQNYTLKVIIDQLWKSNQWSKNNSTFLKYVSTVDLPIHPRCISMQSIMPMNWQEFDSTHFMFFYRFLKMCLQQFQGYCPKVINFLKREKSSKFIVIMCILTLTEFLISENKYFLVQILQVDL